MKRNLDKNKTSQSFKKEGHNWRVALVWFLVPLVIGLGNKLKNDPCFSLSSIFTGKVKCTTNITVDGMGNTMPFSIDETKNTIAFGNETYYDPNVSELVNVFKKLYNNLTPSQKEFYENNSTRIQEAVRADGYFISAEYRYFEWCSSYYKTTVFENKYNQYFSNAKQAVNDILVTAFGRDGINSFNSIMLKVLKKAYDKQVEEDYNGILESLDEDERKGFTKESYCKLLDNYADSLIEQESNNLTVIAPYYADKIK